MPISKIEDAIKDFKKGKMVILVDDADRENEGDLIVAGEYASPDVINFMATHGRGLICVTMDTKVSDRLDLTPVKNSLKRILIQQLLLFLLMPTRYYNWNICTR